MKRKVIAAALALCMTAGLLAGCGAPEPDEVETAAEETAPAEETEETEAAEEAAPAESEETAEGGRSEERRVGKECGS